MNIIFNCGGMGGHIYPVLAIYKEFLHRNKNEDNRYLFVGSDYGLEKEIFLQEGIKDIRLLKSRGLQRRLTLSNIRAIICNIIALLQARRIIGRFHPDIVSMMKLQQV